MSQLALPLHWPADAQGEGFIVTDCNRAAARHLGAPSLWPVRTTLLVGPRKSGRSLLGRIFAAKSGGALIDDAQDRDEEALFHAWNRAQDTRRPLLLVADDPPPAWLIALPDLRSRLAATPVVRIEAPDDALVPLLAAQLLERRGLALPPDVAAWLPTRIERSHVAVLRAVDALDAAMLTRRRRLTLPLARETLEAAGLV